MNEGLVSIITPTYNCGRYIAETIMSVVGQTYADWELIVVDDCSTDDTREIVSRFAAADSRISYHCLNRQSGAAAARNLAMWLARGRWMAFLDSDDLWMPRKLERQIRFMSDNGYAFSYHDYHEIAEDGSDLHVRVSGKRRVGRFDMFACCWPGCLSVMFDREKSG